VKAIDRLVGNDPDQCRPVGQHRSPMAISTTAVGRKTGNHREGLRSRKGDQFRQPLRCQPHSVVLEITPEAAQYVAPARDIGARLNKTRKRSCPWSAYLQNGNSVVSEPPPQ
jgi:hypothetical protein